MVSACEKNPKKSVKRFVGLILSLLVAAGACGGNTASARETTADINALTSADREELENLETESLKYFLSNQCAKGLIYDRQANFGPERKDIQCSLSSTGMGLIAIALASGPDHKLISREDAIARVKKALLCVKTLPAIHGLMPHFFDPETLKWKGCDQVSTIDSAWLIAGGLWAAAYLKDDELQKLADELYRRVDWKYWTKEPATSNELFAKPVIGMGMDEKGKFWQANWDRINSEAAFLYVLAIGAPEHQISPLAWSALKPFYKKVADIEVASGDLGLFANQYSNELMFVGTYSGNSVNLREQAAKAARANYEVCRSLAGKFKTFQHLWGLSAGDGPPNKNENTDAYRAYAPETDVDGTAHVMATLASVDVVPDIVLENIREAEKIKSPKIHGRYGFSNVNLDKNWASHDVVGIDEGAAVMALENKLHDNKVRKVWSLLPCSIEAAKRLKRELETDRSVGSDTTK